MNDTAPSDELSLGTLRDLVPFASTLDMKLSKATADEVHGTLAWSAELCTVGGVLHGGALMALADNVGALVAYLNLPEGSTTSTIESKTNFFRAVTQGQVRAIGRPLHVGRSTIAVRSELFDDKDRLVAHVVQTQSVLSPRTIDAAG